jgi:uncharacterized protein YjdB
MAHLAGIGDTQWVQQGEFVGTTGESRRLEGFAIQARNDAYTVSYMAHLEGTGDTSIFRDGAFCGTRGQSRRVEGVQIWVSRR